MRQSFLSISKLSKKPYAIIIGYPKVAKKQKKKVAVKIRRTDSQRKEMQSEAKLLKIANSVGVGPCLIDSSKNLMIMEYLDGKKIGMWIKELKGKGSVSKLK